MDPIETLMNEHRTIERVLDALVAFVDDVGRKATTEKEQLRQFVTFLREFADVGHHGKEEKILFRAMVECGFPQEDGPIGAMLADHDQGRSLVSILSDRAEQSAPWGDSERQQISEVARSFADMLRSHIEKEDEILYPMAEQHLTPEAYERVGEACMRFEASRAESGAAHRLRALGEELVGPPRLAAGPEASMARQCDEAACLD
jgi:hemerythrin-like domain-containing protein